MAVQWENITLKNRIGKQYHLSCNIEADGKNIEWGKREVEGNLREENQDFKKGWGRISSCSELCTVLLLL